MKKLPKIFQTKINKNLINDQQVFSSLDKKNTFQNSSNKLTQQEVSKKINNLFNSSEYIYKINVEIQTDQGILNKKIIGKNKNYLITIDNEYIPINIIKDINKSN